MYSTSCFGLHKLANGQRQKTVLFSSATVTFNLYHLMNAELIQMQLFNFLAYFIYFKRKDRLMVSSHHVSAPINNI